MIFCFLLGAVMWLCGILGTLDIGSKLISSHAAVHFDTTLVPEGRIGTVKGLIIIALATLALIFGGFVISSF